MVVALMGALLLTSCSQAVRTGQASSYLIVTTLQGQSGAKPGFGSTVQSDVITLVPKLTGVRTVFADQGQATFQLAMKDETSGLAPSAANLITITQYHVDYVRSDGHNVQGVDVPYAFDGAVTVTVTASGGSVAFTLVRTQAKEEAPLQAMGNGGAAITTTAEVTFYGHDQTGRDVSVTGRIEVTFADWGDP
jgi:hypothetical protein